MKDIKIRDLYAGKPDAKDEINFEGWDKFIKTFVVADHFNLELLTRGNHCFITGFKGTGKTALLFYLDDKLKSEDESTCSSLYYRVVVFSDPLQGHVLHCKGCCGLVVHPTARRFKKGSDHSPLQNC